MILNSFPKTKIFPLLHNSIYFIIILLLPMQDTPRLHISIINIIYGQDRNS